MIHDYLYHKVGQGITAAVLLLFLAAFWIFAVEEERAILKDSASRLEMKRLELERDNQEAANVQRYANRYHENLREMARFRREFLQQREERIVSISAFLAEKAGKHGLKMDQVQYRTTHTRQDNLEVYEIELPLLGRYRDIRGFIEDIETSEMFLIITELNLEGESSQRNAVQVQLSLATYFEGGGS